MKKEKNYIKEIIGVIVLIIFATLIIVYWDNISKYIIDLDTKRKTEESGVDKIKKPIGL